MDSSHLPPATLCSIQVGSPQDYGFEGAVDPHDQP